ncbi:MAG: hypothetical protein EOP84_06740 [Verrucomicrobiaceae bacterium]|nr:MAG: hypothetical protein EOP84_06740 [Verrucomicrobiaceae bacterium]
MPRPLYRWKSFWIGLFFLMFLTWSWITGKTTNRWAAISTPAFTITPAQYEGTLGIAVDVRRSMWAIMGDMNEPRTEPGPWFPSPWAETSLTLGSSYH